ncbi:MAG: FAD-dependent oxidoreductase [Clostridia bacterium]|jgi:uncharacterized protein|nr:FAD-dependent oxidoreductase [Clostridia bacterium]MBT7121842.1 FAD-dependent oxidoreductase [Clostridia bacterium]
MSIVVRDIKIPLTAAEPDLKPAVAKKLGLNEGEIDTLRIKKQSIDSRKKDIMYVYTLHVSLIDKDKQHLLENTIGKAPEYKQIDIVYGAQETEQVVIIGAGPCGLFAALTLAKHGYRPLLLDRGADMPARTKDVALLSSRGILNEESNICFGAGGAGAFSDGKLTTRIKDPRADHVLQTLTQFGAPGEILYIAKPHTGTEYIRKAVSGMLTKIAELGGSVQFESKLTALKTRGDSLTGITYTQNGQSHSVDTSAVILAIGHSARDTYQMLHRTGAAMIPKPFAVGLRIEHEREFIDEAQYGESHAMLGAAEYRLTTKHNGRGVYTFCMCPGGEVVNSSTERGGFAVNGMSYYTRKGDNSNSALVVSINPTDFGSNALDGIAFQRNIEQAAYKLTNGEGAPVQTLGDFMRGSVTKQFGNIAPSFKPSTVMADLNACLPDFVSAGIKHAVTDFGKKIRGFDNPDAVLTGVETRTSAPLRILRNADLQAQTFRGLYPAGEGAGYAGGIVSTAVDGIKCAQALMSQFAKPV